MKKPDVKDYDLQPYGYIHDIQEYTESIESNNKELLEACHKLAMLGLQSNRYSKDMDFREAVDNGLAIYNKAKGE